jgi:hypothetical protein
MCQGPRIVTAPKLRRVYAQAVPFLHGQVLLLHNLRKASV